VALNTKINSAQWGSLLLKHKAPVCGAVQRVAGIKFVRGFFGKRSGTRGLGGGVVRPCQAAESKGQQIWSKMSVWNAEFDFMCSNI
jgi:hypothetical protein